MNRTEEILKEIAYKTTGGLMKVSAQELAQFLASLEARVEALEGDCSCSGQPCIHTNARLMSEKVPKEPASWEERFSKKFSTFPVEGDHSEFSDGVFVPDVEVLKAFIAEEKTKSFGEGYKQGKFDKEIENKP